MLPSNLFQIACMRGEERRFLFFKLLRFIKIKLTQEFLTLPRQRCRFILLGARLQQLGLCQQFRSQFVRGSARHGGLDLIALAIERCLHLLPRLLLKRVLLLL
tara:strand:+ start:699 stop:1007 length:309 start_codon:yes stop_codon:yes gene_type:complete